MERNITVIPPKKNSTAGKGKRTQRRKLRVAAYCRVSTDQEEQLLSYENQVRFYAESINSNSEYECAGIYADEGISGTNTKKREEFNRMIADCRAGKIDRIITKSISRFAWRWNAGNGIWKSMGQIPFPTIRSRIHLRRRLYAVSAARFSIGRAGRAVPGRRAGFGSAVNGIR